MKRRVCVSMGVFFSLVLISLTPAYAGTQEFVVVGVGIDQSSQAAEAKALDFARKRAVYLAIKKLGYANASQLASHLSDESLTKIIRGATVAQTRRLENKTYSQVQVTIVDEALANVLSTKSAPQAMPVDSDVQAVRTVLVLPVLVTPGHTYVWEKDNPLRPVLSNELLLATHGLVILPGGDLQDLRLIDRDNVKNVPAEELKPMFDRYGADEIVIAITTPPVKGVIAPTTILMRRLTLKHQHEETITLPPEEPDVAQGENPKPLARVAQTIARTMLEIATSTTSIERARLDAVTKIRVKFSYTIPKQLNEMTAIVRRAPGVLQLELPEIALNTVEGTIYLDGNKAALHDLLLAKSLKLREEGDQWILSLR